MKLKTETYLKIIKSLESTNEEEISCGECYDQVDVFVDMLRDGKEPTEVMLLVKEHLARCMGCKEEFEALLTALEALDETE